MKRKPVWWYEVVWVPPLTGLKQFTKYFRGAKTHGVNPNLTMFRGNDHYTQQYGKGYISISPDYAEDLDQMLADCESVRKFRLLSQPEQDAVIEILKTLKSTAEDFEKRRSRFKLIRNKTKL